MQFQYKNYEVRPIVYSNYCYTTDEKILVKMYDYLEKSKRLYKVFYDGSVYDLQSWLTFLKTPGISALYCVDNNTKQIVHFAWLTHSILKAYYGHHCSFGKIKKDAVNAIFKFWAGVPDGNGTGPAIDIIIGSTPKSMTEAIKFTKVFGYKEVGVIPRICRMLYENDYYDDAVITYLDLHEYVKKLDEKNDKYIKEQEKQEMGCKDKKKNKGKKK